MTNPAILRRGDHVRVGVSAKVHIVRTPSETIPATACGLWDSIGIGPLSYAGVEPLTCKSCAKYAKQWKL